MLNNGNIFNIQVGERVKINSENPSAAYFSQSGDGGGIVDRMVGSVGCRVRWDNGNDHAYAWENLEREGGTIMQEKEVVRAFRAGDRVEITASSPNYTRYIGQSGGSVGTIDRQYSGRGSMSIRWDNGHSNIYSEQDVQHVDDESGRPNRFVMKLFFNDKPTKEHVVMAQDEESAREQAEEYVVMHGYSLKAIEFISK